MIKIRTCAYSNEANNVCDLMFKFTMLIELICFNKWEDIVKIRKSLLKLSFICYQIMKVWYEIIFEDA